MYGFSMIQLVRRQGKRLDRQLKGQMIDLYRSFHWVPCIFHKMAENVLKSTKTYPVVIEFEDDQDAYSSWMNQVHGIVGKTKNCQMSHEYPSISCCSAELTPDGMEALLVECNGIKMIHSDREVAALLDTATPSIHADQARQQAGLSGEGVTIAVLDTGIYPHEDLIYPANRIVAFKDFINDRSQPYDDNGHGTHCAGDAAGNGYSSNGLYQAPAPKAKLVGVKVLDDQGAGSLSTVIAGIQWCIDHKDTYSIDIISLSLGSPAMMSAADDPVVRMVERAWESGITVCVAAGNEGPQARTIASPGISPTVITVGAMNDRNTVDRTGDQVAIFSSRGPTIDGLVKPDLLVPGDQIISLRAPSSYLDRMSKSSRVGTKYFNLSGTSMATPMCAGVVALMLEQNRDLTPDEVKQRLLDACEDWGLPANTQGRGYLNASRAIE